MTDQQHNFPVFGYRVPPPLVSETAGLEEVAQALGISPESLKNRYRTFHRNFGMPMPVCGSRYCWPRLALAAWLRTGGTAKVELSPTNRTGNGQSAISHATTEDDVVQEQRNALKQLYGAGK
ncbi:MAG: hypothetical protein AAF478_03590 [Pseudomonadota bacterium]